MCGVGERQSGVVHAISVYMPKMGPLDCNQMQLGVLMVETTFNSICSISYLVQVEAKHHNYKGLETFEEATEDPMAKTKAV